MHIIELTDEQAEKLEEATDLLAMEMVFCDSYADAVEWLATRYLLQRGPEYEAIWNDEIYSTHVN